MLPKWLQGWFAPGYHKQVNTIAQYQAASRYLREQMQELVAHPCPDSASIEQYRHTLRALAEDLERLQDAMPSLEQHRQQLLNSEDTLQQQALEISPEEKQLKQLTEDITREIETLSEALEIPAHNTYEDTRELLDHWQEQAQRTGMQLSALKQLTSREYFQQLEQELPEHITSCSRLQTRLYQQLEQAKVLEQNITSLSDAIVQDHQALLHVMALHRSFLQKDGSVQQQFKALDQQVPALLKQEAVHSDWFDLVQSWYKANNLATATLKAASGMSPDYHRLNADCTRYQQQLAQCKTSLQELLPPEQSHPIRGELDDFQSTCEQLEIQLLHMEQQLELLSKRSDTMLEDAKKKALKELEHLNTLWRAFQNITQRYVSRKEAPAYRELFDQIRTTLKTPYCLRTLHRSPVPDTLARAEHYGQYLAESNRAYIAEQLTRLDAYFTHFHGTNLTAAQRTALLTEEDYVQVMGRTGYGKSLTIDAKNYYLQEQLHYAPGQILTFSPGASFRRQLLSIIKQVHPVEIAGITDVWAQQSALKELLPQCGHWDILLPAVELHEYLCPMGTTLSLPREFLTDVAEPERLTRETLYLDFCEVLYTYRELLARQQLADTHQLLHMGIQLLHTGQLQNNYTHCLVDDFPLLSPLELAFLRALLKSNTHTKLFCTGEHWDPTDELSYIQKSFPRLPWTHFLIQGLLAEGEAWFANRNYQGGYLFLTETKGEVILLTPPEHL